MAYMRRCGICGKDYADSVTVPIDHKCKKKDIKNYKRYKEIMTDEIELMKKDFVRLVNRHFKEQQEFIKEISKKINGISYDFGIIKEGGMDDIFKGIGQ